MNTTKILGEAVGVQWQGVTDQTETSTVTGLTQAIVIGRFKRGEVGKAMIIHQGNIRSMLGHEPTNPYYIAVQAVLDAGVPSVQVLRVADAAIGQEISCAGATSTLHYELTLNSSWNSNCYIELVINDEVFHVQINPPDAYAAWAVFGNYINNQFANRLQANWVSGNTGSVTVKTNEQFRIKATIVSDPGQSVGMLQFVDNGLNPTVGNFAGDQNFIPYSTVCLSPIVQNQISCDGAADTAVTGGIWQISKLFINGELITDTYSDRMERNNASEIRWEWRNLTDSNLRVRIEADPEYISSNDVGWAENTNPTLIVDFETGIIEFCLAPADCTPSEPLQLLVAGNDPLIDSESGVKHDRVDYRLNGGDVQSFTASNEATTVWHVLDELQTELGMVADTDGHWVFGNNAQGAAFTFGGLGNNPVTIFSAGKAGTDLDVPTTLELIFRDHNDDFINYVIAWEDFKPMVGDNIGYSVILHACGVNEFA